MSIKRTDSPAELPKATNGSGAAAPSMKTALPSPGIALSKEDPFHSTNLISSNAAKATHTMGRPKMHQRSATGTAIPATRLTESWDGQSSLTAGR